ncbi:MAG: hypothetical protein LBI33_00355 [Propionibacteriaceae bacterium]|jgi:hypothetical protein|nr:hypothetical protein [Propionibacteriaceae bacterium]
MTPTDWMSAISELVTAALTVLLVVAAFVAWRTAKQALNESQRASLAAAESAKAAQKANEQAQVDSVRQTRPYVFVELVPSLAGVGCFDIRIVNAGKSSAKHLRLTSDRWPDPMDQVAIAVKRLFDTPRTLPPRCSIRSFWRLTPTGSPSFADGSTEVGMPAEATTIGVTYSDDDGNPRCYSDNYSLMLEDSGLWPAPGSGPDGVGLKGDVRKFYLLGQAIARHVAHIAR